MFDFSGKSVHTIFGDVLLVLSFFLFSGDSVLVVKKTVVGSVQDLVLLLELSDFVSHLIDLDFEVSNLGEQVFGFSLLVLNDDLGSIKFVLILDVGLFLHVELVSGVLDLLLKFFDVLLLVLLVFLEVLDVDISLLDFLLKVLLLSVKKLSVSLELSLFLSKFINLVFLLHDFFLFFAEFSFEFDDLLVKSSLSQLKVINLGLFVFNILLKLLLLSDKLMNGVILTK